MPMASLIPFGYLLTPTVGLSHLIGGCLVYSLYTQGLGFKYLAPVACLEELLSFLLWFFIPNSFCSIIAIAICIFVYEQLALPDVELRKNAVLIVGKTKTFLKTTIS
jgi:hypothetical protein